MVDLNCPLFSEKPAVVRACALVGLTPRGQNALRARNLGFNHALGVLLITVVCQERLVMVKLAIVVNVQGDASTSDLRSQVHFCAQTGQIWLHEHRMLLIHAQAQALLPG